MHELAQTKADVCMNLLGYDAFMQEPDHWVLKLVEFVRIVLQQQMRVRVIGVCFGHQIIARALGVMPTRSQKGWEVAVTPVHLTDSGKWVFGLEELVRPPHQRLKTAPGPGGELQMANAASQHIHQMHRDVVPECPPHVLSLGSSERCDVQGMYSKGRMLSVQGHPEYSGKIANELLDLRRGTKLDEVTYFNGKKRANLAHDGVAVAAGFLRFLMEE